MMAKKRILFYSHDTFGLGHIRRTQKLANKIASPDRSILIACASPKASSYVSSPGIEYLNLPGFTKQVSGDYVPRGLNLPIEEFVQLRASLLLSAARSFNPDVLIIDKEPLGVKRELIPALEYLRNYNKKCQIVCGFRDILDDDATVQKEWNKRDTVKSLENYFDHILIYGEKDIFNFADQYQLPPSLEKKIIYTGYIHPEENLEKENIKLKFSGTRPLVTLTLGGGGDGGEILETVLPVFKQDPGFDLILLTGPFAPSALIEEAKLLARDRDYLMAREFVANALDLFKASDLVVSMGGYNTMIELLSLQKKSLILPRVKPRQEQLIRAQMFQRRGACDYIHPDELTGEGLIKRIHELLPRSAPAQAFPARGLSEFKTWMDSIL